MSESLNKLKIHIRHALAMLDKDVLPNVYEMAQSEQGKKRLEEYIIRHAEKYGMGVYSALAQIESELG